MNMKTTQKQIEELLAEGYVEVEGYEGLYMINRNGSVFNLRWAREIKVTNAQKYQRVKLRDKFGNRRTIDLHRLLAIAFIPNTENKPFVNHIDENGFNNDLSNLEWVTHTENINHGTAQERRIKSLKKPIEQYDLEGNLVATFDSAKDIQEQLGYSSSSICKVCKGQRPTAYQYIWKFAQTA